MDRTTLLLILASLGVGYANHHPGPAACRCMPSDACWPSSRSWSSLNDTVGGRLIKTVPLGAPCHFPTYNATECSVLAAGWIYPQTHMDNPSSIVEPYFQHQSCDPFTSPASPCRIGNYVSYAINVSSAADVIAGLSFASKQNVRLVIKNSGHDLLGKSTGKGGLSLWTHNLKSINVFDYSGPSYQGKAMKMAAGVQAWEAYTAADAAGVVVIGGTCTTVGLAGGYTQGGGYGQLSSRLGLAADSVLEWEVITAQGQHLIATPQQNKDLFWALSGGGGGTFGVVLSMTVKAYPDSAIGGASLVFTSYGLSQDVYWKAVGKFLTLQPALVDDGAVLSFLVSDLAFEILVSSFPGKTEDQVTAALQPLSKFLESSNITYTLNVTSHSTYLSHMVYYTPGWPYGFYPSAQVTSSRLIPRSVVQNNLPDLIAALRDVTSSGHYYLVGTSLNVAYNNTKVAPNNNAAILPAWRNTITQLIIPGIWNYTAPWATNAALEKNYTHNLMPALEKVTPGSGIYLNEGNFQQKDWQQNFYGSNYPRLLSVKHQYDPDNLFYAPTAVGSEAWRVLDGGGLCRT